MLYPFHVAAQSMKMSPTLLIKDHFDNLILGMINSVTCVYSKDKKTFEKIKDFFRLNVGLMALWLLFQQTTCRMYLHLPHHFGKSVTYDN